MPARFEFVKKTMDSTIAEKEKLPINCQDLISPYRTQSRKNCATALQPNPLIASHPRGTAAHSLARNPCAPSVRESSHHRIVITPPSGESHRLVNFNLTKKIDCGKRIYGNFSEFCGKFTKISHFLRFYTRKMQLNQFRIISFRVEYMHYIYNFFIIIYQI